MESWGTHPFVPEQYALSLIPANSPNALHDECSIPFAPLLPQKRSFGKPTWILNVKTS
jgi:hypothetical protein